MKKNTAKKSLGFMLGLVLSASGFILGGFGFTEEAVALADCEGDGTFGAHWGFKCTNGNCAEACFAPANASCHDSGATCIMGPSCAPFCPM